MSTPADGPRVSVCIPTYNYGQFLAETIESVLGQTYGSFELVVSDNCSTDDTPGIVAEYRRRDARIRYFRNESNVGMVGNWNRCLERASGTYVKILCADDLLEPTCLAKSVAALEEHPSAALVCTGRMLVDRQLRSLRTVMYADHFVSSEGRQVIRECLFKGNLIGEPTAVLFRRDSAGRGFLEAYRQLTDLEMWFHILEQGDFIAIPEILCRFRQHEGQETIMNRRSLAFADDEFLIYESYIRKPYVRCSFLQKLKIKFTIAMRLWETRREGVEVGAIRKKMSQHFNLYLFHLLRSLYILRQRHSSRSARTP